MVKTNNNGTNISPFLAKCYEMVDDVSTDSIISWGQSDDSFVIWDMTEFSRDLLPKYFKHSNFSSFVRQLNIYGFRKVDSDRWEFANEGFIKGQKHLLSNIKRRKHPHSLAQPKDSKEQQPVEAPEQVDYLSLQKEVEILKTDKNSLMQELVKLKECQETSQNKLLVLVERFQGMEKIQQQLLSFLVMVMQSPGLLVQLCQPKEGNWRMAEAGKITFNEGTENATTVSGDGLIIRYQPQSDEALLNMLEPSSDSEKTMEHDLSFDSVKDLFMNSDLPSVPLDDHFPPENWPIKLPELDLRMLEQFLLSSPSRDDSENVGLQEEEPFNSDMSMEPLFSATELDKSK
ncbi:hypothetical protein Ancab_018385 [Ancistrocladus abbreviatus]